MRRRVLAGLVACVALSVGACESGPSGPGVLTGTVTADQPLGAVVLELTGTGIQGFAGQGGSKAYGAQVSAQNARFRVVVVGTGQLGFGVDVDDVKGPTPTVQVVSAVDAQNAPVGISGVKVTLGR